MQQADAVLVSEGAALEHNTMFLTCSNHKVNPLFLTSDQGPCLQHVPCAWTFPGPVGSSQGMQQLPARRGLGGVSSRLCALGIGSLAWMTPAGGPKKRIQQLSCP